MRFPGRAPSAIIPVLAGLAASAAIATATTISGTDGEVDTVDCWEGDDVASLDLVAVIADATAENPNGACEKLVRRLQELGEDDEENASRSPSEDARQD